MALGQVTYPAEYLHLLLDEQMKEAHQIDNDMIFIQTTDDIGPDEVKEEELLLH